MAGIGPDPDRQEELAAFARALQTALRAEGVANAELGRRVGRTGESVRQWLLGASEPEPWLVFRVEAELRLRPGALSRHLGYVPAGSAQPAPSVLDALAADATLDEESRATLAMLWRTLAGRSPRRSK